MGVIPLRQSRSNACLKKHFHRILKFKTQNDRNQINDLLGGQSKRFNQYVALAGELGVKYPPDSYAVIVESDHMNNGGIADSDVVIMQSRFSKNGDVVDAIIKGKGTMLKRYHVRWNMAVR